MKGFFQKMPMWLWKKGWGTFFLVIFAVQNFWSQNLGVVKVSYIFWRIINSSTGWFFSFSSNKNDQEMKREHLNTWDIFTTKQIDLACQLLVVSWFSKPILSQWCRRHPFPGHSELDIWSLKKTLISRWKTTNLRRNVSPLALTTRESLVNKGTLLERFHGASSSSKGGSFRFFFKKEMWWQGELLAISCR